MNEFLNKAINVLIDDNSRRIILEKYYHRKTNTTTYYARLEEQRFNKALNKTYYTAIDKVAIDEFSYKNAYKFLEHKDYVI